MDRQTVVRMDGLIDGCMDGWMYGQMDGRTKYPLHSTGHRPFGDAAQKGCYYLFINKHKFVQWLKLCYYGACCLSTNIF